MKYCPVCRAQLDDNATTCNVCMSPVAAAPAPQAPQAPQYQAPVAPQYQAPVAPQYQAPQAPQYQVPASQATAQAPATEKPGAADKVKGIAKKLPKKALIIGAAAIVAVVLLVILVSALFSTPKAFDYVMYIKDREIYSAKMPSGKPWLVTDEPGSSYAYMSKDAKHIIFNDEDGDLFYRQVGSKKEAVKIVSGVSVYSSVLSENGKKIAYQKEDKLYVGTLKEQEKIASDVEDMYGFTLDLKRGLYKDTEGDLYFINGKKTEKIGAGYVEWLSKDCKTVIFEDEGDLYKKSYGKDKVKIASDVSTAILVTDKGAGYYLTREEDEETSTLFYFDGSKSKEIAKDVTDWEDYAIDAAVFVYAVEEDIYVAVKDKTSQLNQDEAFGFDVSPEGKSIYFLQDADEEDGTATLYQAKISGGKVKAPEKIDEEVEGGEFLEEGKYLYYKDYEDEHATVYLNNSKKKVDDDVYVDSIRYAEEKGIIYYFTDYEEGEGTLRAYKSKAVTVADDVAKVTLMPNGEIVFLNDYDYEKGEGILMIYTGSGKAKKIDEDVSSIVPVEKARYVRD